MPEETALQRVRRQQKEKREAREAKAAARARSSSPEPSKSAEPSSALQAARDNAAAKVEKQTEDALACLSPTTSGSGSKFLDVDDFLAAWDEAEVSSGYRSRARPRHVSRAEEREMTANERAMAGARELERERSRSPSPRSRRRRELRRDELELLREAAADVERARASSQWHCIHLSLEFVNGRGRVQRNVKLTHTQRRVVAGLLADAFSGYYRDMVVRPMTNGTVRMWVKPTRDQGLDGLLDEMEDGADSWLEGETEVRRGLYINGATITRSSRITKRNMPTGAARNLVHCRAGRCGSITMQKFRNLIKR